MPLSRKNSPPIPSWWRAPRWRSRPRDFHAWQDRAPSARTLSDQRLTQQIKEIFLASGKTYGARRVYAELSEERGYSGSLNRVKRLMREAGLKAKAKRKF